MKRDRILVITRHYLPGYKGGGPIRSLENMVEWFSSEVDFRILTTDRDLGDENPYSSIQHGIWHSIGSAHVRYLSPKELNYFFLRNIINAIDYDRIYINSFFSLLSIKIILLNYFKQIKFAPIVLAPQGEFSPSAISLSRWKKLLYLRFVKLFRIYENLIWQSSGPYESNHIKAIWGNNIRIQEVIDLPSPLPPKTVPAEKILGSLKIIFLGRISPMKNLDYALHALQRVNQSVHLDIYGPLENLTYWRKCDMIIENLPSHITAKYCGEINPKNVHILFQQYHLLFLPTQGENFGHVIFEALSSGCPVLISDQTPWRQLAESRAGWDVSLLEPERFTSILETVAMMDQENFDLWSTGSRQFAEDFMERESKKWKIGARNGCGG